MLSSPVKWLLTFLLAMASPTSLALGLTFLSGSWPRNVLSSCKFVGSLVITNTELPNFSSAFLALLTGEKRAGLSQLYRAVTSSRVLVREAPGVCLPCREQKLSRTGTKLLNNLISIKKYYCLMSRPP